jgi:hypothetical protein
MKNRQPIRLLLGDGEPVDWPFSLSPQTTVP